MKNKFVVSISTLFLFSALLITASSAFAGWHDLSQIERNHASLETSSSYSVYYIK